MDSITTRPPLRCRRIALVLTTPTLAHVPEMAALANSQAIYELLARLPRPYTESDGRFFVQSIARGESEFAWSILRDGSFIGVIGLHLLPDRPPELGYWLGEPFWGQGYGSEVAIVVAVAAKAAGVAALQACALSSNSRSRKVLAKAGFVETCEGPGPSGTNAGKPTTFMRLQLAPESADLLPPSIQLGRLTLRAPALRDLPDIVALANNPKMVETTATLPLPFAQSDGYVFIAQADGPGRRAYAIAGTDDRFMGTMLFKPMDGKHPEIGYWLGEPRCGQGYAAEALKGLLEAVRHLRDFATIDARVLQSNPASIRVLEKAGFVITERITSVVERHRGKPLLIIQRSAS
ncbi:MAG: GNAT family N-acetyltransferase [Candidatus Devosia euplotis]|nr:GNAT family N-acetyltransferase [Candidatus Devosia euplotis]